MSKRESYMCFFLSRLSKFSCTGCSDPRGLLLEDPATIRTRETAAAWEMEEKQGPTAVEGPPPTASKTCRSRVVRVDPDSLAMLPHPFRRDLMKPWQTTTLKNANGVRPVPLIHPTFPSLVPSIHSPTQGKQEMPKQSRKGRPRQRRNFATPVPKRFDDTRAHHDA
jgi:hypothetical protein